MNLAKTSYTSIRIGPHALALTLATLLTLSGCGREPLDELQDAAARAQACLIKRTYRDECQASQQALEKARLLAVKAGRQPEQIDAALALGKLAVTGHEEDSPYADFSRRRREILAANLMKQNPDFKSDESLARALEALENANEPLSKRQRAEAMLIQSMLEERFPHHFAEPEDGIETDPEILSLICKEGARANAAQACQRFHRQKR